MMFVDRLHEVYRYPSALFHELTGILTTPFRRRDSVQIEVTVLLRDRIDSEDVPVVSKLKCFGLTIERVLPRLSIITGRLDQTRLVELEGLPEVRAVEKAGIFTADPQVDP
jgi:hypothetical protein